MTRPVNELRHQSEQSRAELAATVDQLKERISETADDIRHKVSPQHIKSEVSDYISHKTQSWIEAVKQQALENPMQAIAVGAAVAVPVMRLARSSSLPLLMMGAGLALTSKTLRERGMEAAAPAIKKTGKVLNDAAERAQALQGDLNEGLSSAQGRADGLIHDAQEAAASAADGLRSRTAEAASTVADKLKSGVEAAKETAAAAKVAAAEAPAKAQQVIGENAALIGGLGIAIGAIIAAALPRTKAETGLMGQASDSMNQAAAGAAQSGFEAAKDAAVSAADAAAKSVAAADLGGHASRMTQNMADKLKEAGDDVMAAAFNPSRNPKT